MRERVFFSSSFFFIKTNWKAKRKTLGRYCALRCCCCCLFFVCIFLCTGQTLQIAVDVGEGWQVCAWGAGWGGKSRVWGREGTRGGGGNGCRVTRELTDKWEEEQRRVVLIRTRKEQGIKNSWHLAFDRTAQFSVRGWNRRAVHVRRKYYRACI